MDIVRTDTTEQFVRTATAWISGVLMQAITDHGSATMGLCGGFTPKPVYTMLATDQHIGWSKVTCFLTDERYVPATHQDSNQKMVRETLLTREGGSAVFHAPKTGLLLDKCIAEYAETIKKIGAPDLVVLGMGDDGHITSLFPPVPPEAFGSDLVIHTQTDRFAGKDRISLTFSPLLHAKKRLFLITGEKKAALLRTMQDANEDVSLYPAQYLFDEKTTWIVGP